MALCGGELALVEVRSYTKCTKIFKKCIGNKSAKPEVMEVIVDAMKAGKSWSTHGGGRCRGGREVQLAEQYGKGSSVALDSDRL